MKASIRVNHDITIDVTSTSPYEDYDGRIQEPSVTFTLRPKGQKIPIPDLTCLLTLEEAEEAGKKLLRAVEDARAGKYTKQHTDVLEMLQEEMDEIRAKRA
ncbi:hypothetical protein GQ85_06350 [Rhodococcus rhodochrous]|nr:hypothetical protein GQ85_06350 [Rhodococcus rhodochrous]